MSGLTIVFGAGSIGDSPMANAHSAEEAKPYLDACKKHNVTHLDTAVIYPGSEKILGDANAGEDFVIDTKNPGGFYGFHLTGESLISVHKNSLDSLKLDHVDVLYIHGPDEQADLADWLPAMNQLYQEGKCKRFGLSNFLAKDVKTIYDFCKQKGYVLPSVYQGNYSAVARRQDAELFPTLRELNIAFYAYSPLAGGFLTKTKQQILDGTGRFDPNHALGPMYTGLYARPSYLEALAEWEDIAKEANISRAELAYRWVSHNSPLSRDRGDAIIIGASSVHQLEQTIVGLAKGPLDDKTAKRIDGVWETIKHEAPLDNLDGMRA